MIPIRIIYEKKVSVSLPGVQNRTHRRSGSGQELPHDAIHARIVQARAYLHGWYVIKHVGVEFGDRIITVGDARVKLQLWDTAGQEKFRAVVRNFYRHSSVVLLVYDITKSNITNAGRIHSIFWHRGLRTRGRIRPEEHYS